MSLLKRYICKHRKLHIIYSVDKLSLPWKCDCKEFFRKERSKPNGKNGSEVESDIEIITRKGIYFKEVRK